MLHLPSVTILAKNKEKKCRERGRTIWRVIQVCYRYSNRYPAAFLKENEQRKIWISGQTLVITPLHIQKHTELHQKSLPNLGAPITYLHLSLQCIDLLRFGEIKAFSARSSARFDRTIWNGSVFPNQPVWNYYCSK